LVAGRADYGRIRPFVQFLGAPVIEMTELGPRIFAPESS
jgi:hypothetical protein